MNFIHLSSFSPNPLRPFLLTLVLMDFLCLGPAVPQVQPRPWASSLPFILSKAGFLNSLIHLFIQRCLLCDRTQLDARDKVGNILLTCDTCFQRESSLLGENVMGSQTLSWTAEGSIKYVKSLKWSKELYVYLIFF